MTKDEQFALVKKDILDHVNSWSDLYEFFDELMLKVRETMHPHYVMDAVFTFYAFMQAMREMPEEGDIKVLTLRMMKIMIYESKEKLGADISIISKEEADALVLAAALVDIVADPENDKDKSTKTLH